MSKLKCEKCGREHTDASYYCTGCGAFLAQNRFETEGVTDETERKIRRILHNLQKSPHYPIVWNETVDAYTRKVERMQSLLRIAQMNIESGELNQKIDDFLTLCQKPDFQIAFVGTIKTGKSTLINALLGHNYASVDVTPETAVLTKFRSSKKDYIHVTFYSVKEWEKLWKTVQKGADKFLEKYNELRAESVKEQWLGHRQEHIEVENRDIEKELFQWSSSKSPVHYFVKELEVGISTLPKEFPSQVVFVDTPGLSDPVEYRSQISREYIHKANAVFVCVDAQKIYKEEIETIASVFSFSSHNKNKVHIIATHWDALNDPKGDWEKKQKPYMVEQLTGAAFYDKKMIAEQKIMYAAAYIYNLCRKYSKLEAKEKKIVQILPIKLDMDIEFGLMTERNLQEIMEICNIKNINQVIVNELIANYSKLLYEDIEQLYRDIRYVAKRVSAEQKKELGERISLSDADIEALKAKLFEKQKSQKEIQQSQEQLKAALGSLEKRTKERLEEMMGRI